MGSTGFNLVENIVDIALETAVFNAALQTERQGLCMAATDAILEQRDELQVQALRKRSLSVFGRCHPSLM